MKVTFVRQEYICTKAVKDTDKAILYLEGGEVIEFVGVNDWGAFSIEGGGWSGPEPSREEKLEAEVAELKEALDLLLSGVTE